MLKSRDLLEGFSGRGFIDLSGTYAEVQAVALVEIAEALTGLLKLAKETGEPYYRGGS